MKTIPLRFLHPEADPDEWDRDPRDQRVDVPAYCTPTRPYMYLELELISGTMAGTPWVVLKVVDCIDLDLVGKEICCENTYVDDDGNLYLIYEAKMGGEVIPVLDGMRFWVPKAAWDAFMPEADGEAPYLHLSREKE
jgi:hypothetical protein